MDTSLAALISDLKSKPSMSIQGTWLPDEQTARKIGETRSCEALPHLEEALQQANKFKSICENMQSQVNTGAAGSASPFIAAMLAEQSIEAIRDAISRCR